MGAWVPDEIDYVNAHGTATREGDPIEIAAIRGVSDHAPAEVAVSATKSYACAHAGRTGVIEAIITVLSLASQEAPPTAYLDASGRRMQGRAHITGGSLRGSLRAALRIPSRSGASNTCWHSAGSLSRASARIHGFSVLRIAAAAPHRRSRAGGDMHSRFSSGCRASN